MTELLRRNLIPLIVATALFMENMDATVLATSLPAIAKDLSVNPINLKLALTTYLLALAVFIPASGWMADRFGAKNVFRAAMVVFAIGSIACALSTGLVTLVAARVLQGMGGAMMTPVGRLIVLRARKSSARLHGFRFPRSSAPSLGLRSVASSRRISTGAGFSGSTFPLRFWDSC